MTERQELLINVGLPVALVAIGFAILLINTVIL